MATGTFKTFGANINELLTESFFMEGTIGEFATREIEQLAKELQSEAKASDRSPEDITNMIEEVADDIIRDRLKDLYREKYKIKSMTPTEEIRLLEEKIQQLKLRMK